MAEFSAASWNPAAHWIGVIGAYYNGSTNVSALRHCTDFGANCAGAVEGAHWFGVWVTAYPVQIPHAYTYKLPDNSIANGIDALRILDPGRWKRRVAC